jgi:hypothetical protein|tara:strand:+ start:376 stop:561 length:186 start_codon:yes stop_codon:yes gene_type:complete
MSLDYKAWINKVKEWDGFTWVVLPLLYLEKFVKLIAGAAYKAWYDWDTKRFNDSLPSEKTD